jgi:hypothetical protein
MSMRTFVFVTLLVAAGSAARAQPIGTFRWQMQPYCNVLALNVTQTGGVYTLDGFDDQCGAATVAPLTGTAIPNPNGTIELGLNIVTSPGGAPLHVAVPLSVATLGGTWRDSAGATGNFAFTPGNGTGGSPRPLPGAVIPNAFALQGDGGFLAEGTLGQGAIPDSGAGTRMMWYAGKAAFRAGEVTTPAWDDPNVGQHSAAFNLDTVASGARSAAFGHETVASAPNSAAFGYRTQANGAHATAIGTDAKANGFSSFALGTNTIAVGDNAFAQGSETEASGVASVALGVSTKAIGSASLAAGSQSTASGIAATAFGVKASALGIGTFAAGTETAAIGDRSVVFGSYARTNVSDAGSFLFGDASTTTVLTAPAANSFAARAAGGVRFYTNAAMTAGAYLPAGSGSWSALSDVNMKENFRDLDGDDVLTKLARMPIREWNYKAQDAVIRHAGPTAQDFHAAFGLGEDPLRISTIDADGIALRAVQALETRTREFNEKLAELYQRIATLEATLDARPR